MVVLLIIGGYLSYEYVQDRFGDRRIVQNILDRDRYVVEQNDIYFSFHTTFRDMNYSEGTLLYNMVINDDGTFTTVGSYKDFQLTDLEGNDIRIGQIGIGPGSDFSFGIDPSEYEKIKNGFHVRYSGMFLYHYSIQ
ncbi:hypothetical protein [Paenibacillus turpanensis]|uniref:hypothetical protein n=1 Tax=Paenibacillus turpanensis TaxID=2689078 RepID=UPI00140CA505|nr:hypothetical protein [Paenibacillus turpanensis]